MATTTTTTTSKPKPKPVIIVGSGLAGLSAASSALAAGAPAVHMLDRSAKPGGNSIKASSGINGADTRFQQQQWDQQHRHHLRDDPATFYADTVRSAGAAFLQEDQGDSKGNGGGIDRKALITLLTHRSADAVAWLADDIGVDLSVVSQLGGHSTARTHRGAGKLPPGAAIVSALLKRLKEDPRFELHSGANVESLIVGADDDDDDDDDDGVGSVRGVRYKKTTTTTEGKEQEQEEQELEGPVVFAAGGFAGDAHGLLARYRPDLAGVPSTNEAAPASHGLLTSVGAALVDMESVQVHPTGFVDPRDPGAAYKFLAAEALRGEGAILLASGTGKRFVNEMETRDVVSAAIMGLPLLPPSSSEKEEEEGGGSATTKTRQWPVTILLDPGACAALAPHVGFYEFKGLLQRKTVRELPAAVIASVDEYAASVAAAAGTPDGSAAFGRKSFGHWSLPAGEANRDEEVCVGTVTPVTHFTMGGVAFNAEAQVLRRRKEEGEGGLEPIQGLWAAGEITGGIHGANRLGGSSLLECVVFGRIAGAQAARYTLI
ncbi:Flavocytochrome c [Xylariomycetidae sp. FL2044]|nr:Flavocytochrome c [Xylariomycetidae sp. FL2044]